MAKFILLLVLAISIYFVYASESSDPNVCSQAIESGRCLAYMPRYAYNIVTKKCERFIYGGCGANDNNFITLEQCQDQCEK